jgi:hypothetical protein
MKNNGTIKKCIREPSTEKKFLITNSIDNKILDFFQYCITVIKDEIARFVYDIRKHPV